MPLVGNIWPGMLSASAWALRLPLGEEAVARIRGKLERQLADLEATMDLTLSTAYSW